MVEREPVPDNAEPIIVVDKDKEQQFNMVMLMFKHDATPNEEKGNMMYLLEGYVKSMSTSMLNQRLSEKAQEADCPYLQASASDEEYLFSSTKDAFSLTVIPKEGKTIEALASALREAQRAVQFGFNASEYVRVRSEYLSQLDKTFTNREKRNNAIFGDECTEHFLDNEPILSIEDQKMLMEQIAPNIPVSKNDSNLVIVSFNTEKEGTVYPTKEEFLSAINTVRGEKLEAYVDNVKNEPLIAKLPKKGKIKSEKENAKFGYKELTLSNGARVILKKTDYKADEIQMMAISKGGNSLLGENDIVNSKLFSAVTASSGLGEFDNQELEKALAGIQASANLSMSNLHEMVSGNCVPKDVETMMQLVYLNFTNIKKDEKAYNSMVNMIETMLKNRSLTPETAFADSVSATVYMHNPRFLNIDAEDLKKLDYDRCLQIAKERTANAADFTFFFVGNFDEATLRPLIEQYIASLPGNPKKKENWKPVSTYAKGNVINKFTRKMETPKAQARMMWYNLEQPYTLENAILADAAGQVLDMIYLKKIREEASAAYSAGAAGSATLGGDTPYTGLIGVCPMKPEMADEALKIMREEIENMTKTVDADMLKKIKEALVKDHETNAKKNSYWMDVISDFDELGVILAGGNHVEVVMLPEE